MPVIQTACVPGTGGIAVYITADHHNDDSRYRVVVDGHGKRVEAERGVEAAARATANRLWSEIVQRRNEGWSGPELVRAAGCVNLDGVHEVKAPEAPVEVTEGFWVLDGPVGSPTSGIYKVQRSQSSGRLYAKRANSDGGFEYVPGAMSALRLDGHTKALDKETAATFGKLYGMCCMCGRTLTDENSIEAGIGPVCAGKRGW